MSTATNLTEASLSLFLQLANDADNWSGQPLFEGGEIEKGNLTDLKKKGLIGTDRDEGCTWVYFTEQGASLAFDHNIEIEAND